MYDSNEVSYIYPVCVGLVVALHKPNVLVLEVVLHMPSVWQP